MYQLFALQYYKIVKLKKNFSKISGLLVGTEH